MNKKTIRPCDIKMDLSFMSGFERPNPILETMSAFIKENIVDISQENINNINVATEEALHNAKHHAYPEGTTGIIRVTCSYKKNNNTFTVSVTDNGCGMTKEELEENPRSRSAKLRVAERL